MIAPRVIAASAILAVPASALIDCPSAGINEPKLPFTDFIVSNAVLQKTVVKETNTTTIDLTVDIRRDIDHSAITCSATESYDTGAMPSWRIIDGHCTDGNEEPVGSTKTYIYMVLSGIQNPTIDNQFSIEQNASCTNKQFPLSRG
jgi:hypothetical protein